MRVVTRVNFTRLSERKLRETGFLFMGTFENLLPGFQRTIYERGDGKCYPT